jgi:RNA polymerase sigma-70 factor (ECF subfamily)
MTGATLASSPARLVAVGAREEQFRAFYAAEYPSLARYAYKLVSDAELAHDLAQEAFSRMYGRWVKVTEPRAYLYGVTTNLARKTWRTRARDAAVLEQLQGEPQRDVPSHDTAVVLRASVQGIPAKLRDVVLLHYFADLPVAQVAAAVGRPEGTVKRQLSEARALLALALGGPDD